MPRSFATRSTLRPLVSVSRTASRLNSFVNRLCLFLLIATSAIFHREWLSTFAGQVQTGSARAISILRHIFEGVVIAAMGMGLVKGEGFAVDASVMEANASRYHGRAPDELDWTKKQQRKREVAEYLAALEAEAAAEGDAQHDNESGGPEGKRQRRYERQPSKVISPSDPQSAWTAKANKRVQFGYGMNYLIDIENAVIVDVEATPARTYDEVAATQTMLDRAEECFDLKPRRLAADTAYGTGKFLGWLSRRKKLSRTSLYGRRATDGTASSPVQISTGTGSAEPHLPQRQTAADQWYRARRTYATVPRLEAGLRRVPNTSEVLHHGRCTQDPA